MTFEEYMAECDRVLIGMLGVATDDLADWSWRDAYNDEMPPAEAVRESLENDGTLPWDYYDLLDL
jgi:hypothetical protein